MLPPAQPQQLTEWSFKSMSKKCKAARGRTKLKMMHNAFIENWEHAHNMTHDDVTSYTTAFLFSLQRRHKQHMTL